MNFTELSLDERDRLIDERVLDRHRKHVPRYHSNYHAAWTLIVTIAALPDMPFSFAQKKRLFMHMLGMEPCNNLIYGALTLKQLAAITPERIGTAALYAFGREEEN